jgi:tol-pal system protein YbgF
MRAELDLRASRWLAPVALAWVLTCGMAMLQPAFAQGTRQPLADSQALGVLLQRLDSLQREVRELRGQVETLTHESELLRRRQRDQYLDVDARLTRVEGAEPAQARTQTPEVAPEADRENDSNIEAERSSAGQRAELPGPGDAAGGADAAEETSYRTAFDLLQAARYEEAGPAFERYLSAHPDGKYASNAQYWLGEVYYVTRKLDGALSEFESVVDRYPESNKVPDALLKMAFIYQERGDPDRAREYYHRVIENYGRTAAAGLARDRLQELGETPEPAQ